MDVCFLCLEGVKSVDECILVDSEKWLSQNFKDLINVHLWPMQQINTSSWICVGCGGVLHDFHTFYNRIRHVQHSYGAVFKTEDTSTEQENDLEFENGENLDNFKENLFNKNGITDCHLEPHITLEQPLPTEFVIDGPFIKCQTECSLNEDDKELNTHRKRGRSAKNVSLGTIDSSEDPLMKIEKTSRKCRRKKKQLDCLKSNLITEKVLELERKRSPIPESINNSPISLDIKDNNSETDPEHHDEEETSAEAAKKKNHRNVDETTLKAYDQIIANNFKIFCNLCQLEMENFLSLRRHFKIQHKQRGYARCCKRNFFTRSLLVDHIQVHLNPDYFKCHQCSKVFSDRSRLLCHKKLHEDDSKLDKCNICGKLFADKGALKKHVLTHSSKKLFPCTICGKFFTNSFILNHHIEGVHQNKFVQICDICGKSIRCPTSFASHMEKHEVKTTSISCDVCGLLLTSKEGLKRHKNSQHPEGGKKEHTCHICSKVSPTQRALQSHIRSVHEQGFDFKCSLCEKSFKRPAVLKEHMATHTGTALYTCLWCPRTFISNGNMYNHRKKAHPKEWEELKRQKYAGNMSEDSAHLSA